MYNSVTCDFARNTRLSITTAEAFPTVILLISPADALAYLARAETCLGTAYVFNCLRLEHDVQIHY